MRSYIIIKAINYIESLFHEQLPSNRSFHNLKHTKTVIKGVESIIELMDLSESDKEVVLLSAIFHDSGHIKTYYGHENASKQIAEKFLIENHYDKSKLEIVLQTIEATKMPQTPSTKLQKVLCDADLSHLAQEEYFSILKDLRKEWFNVLSRKFSDMEWKLLNKHFLESHDYFTKEAKEIWDKKGNISKIDEEL